VVLLLGHMLKDVTRKKTKKGGKVARAYEEGQASFEDNIDKDNEGHAELQQNFAGVEQGDWAFASFAVPALNVMKKTMEEGAGHALLVRDEFIAQNVADAVESLDAPTRLAGVGRAVEERMSYIGVWGCVVRTEGTCCQKSSSSTRSTATAQQAPCPW